jgi:hypothetical protein
MAKKKKQVPVIFVETFKGGKYLFRLDKPYEEEMNSLFASLIEQSGFGSIANISKRYMDMDKYDQAKGVKIINGNLQTQ